MATMADEELDVIRGTLDLMLLKALSWTPMHGLGLIRWIEQASDSVLQIDEGALYPALHRMEIKGWLQANWGYSESNRRAKYYHLTPAGRRELQSRRAKWSRYARALDLILDRER